MRAPPHSKAALTVLATLLPAGAPVRGEDCNRNGIEDRVEIETPAIDFRLADGIESTSAESLAALDFDGDGDEDLAVVTGPDKGLALLRNGGTGRLAPAGSVALPPLRRSLRTADLDGDSDLDIVFLLPFESRILWNDRDGSFSRTSRLAIGSGPFAVEAADLDLDRDLDLFTANFTGNPGEVPNVSVLLNEGQGRFGPPRNFASGAASPILSLADLDGDGDLDAVAGTFERNDITLLENDGNARFLALERSREMPPLQLIFLARVDVDGDGRDEIFAAGRSQHFILSHVGGGQLEVKARITASEPLPEAILAADITGDGRVDVTVTTACPDFVILEGLAGGFGEPRSFWVGEASRFLAAAELDGDGLPDLAGIGRAGSRVFTLLQERSTLARDCNRNGIPDGCDPDCDRNGTPDDCDLSSGASPDCDANGTPDACDPDCDANGIPDACDIAAGGAPDCDGNGVPDACERFRDADGNGVPDACDIARDPGLDCDGSGTLDTLDFEPRPRFAQEEYELGIRPGFGRLSDLDGDGDADILAVNEGAGEISIAERLEDGSLAHALTLRPGTPVSAIASLDADRDGDLDIAIAMDDPACREERGWVALFRNHGRFRFGRGAAVDLEATPRLVEPADLDGDGITDLLAALDLSFPGWGPVWAVAGRGDGTFAEPLEIVERASGITLADLDGDGDVDIASGGGRILLNEGGWTFVEGPPGPEAHPVAAGDIDGDSDVDLVARIAGGLSVLLNDGAARFTPGFDPEVREAHLALGNLDGDHRADIVTAPMGYHETAVSAFLSRGSHFVAVLPAGRIGSRPSSLLLGDLDADGLEDAVALLPAAGSAVVLRNLGDGFLSCRTAITEEHVEGVLAGVADADAGDLDGDLDLDLVAVGSGSRGRDPTITLFENDGNGSYAQRALIEHPVKPRLIRIGDVTGDGRADLVLEDERGDAGEGFSVIPNEGAWTFGSELRGPAGARTRDLALADFDADGHLDVARLHHELNAFSVALTDEGGKWGDPEVTKTGVDPRGLLIVNLDADGLPDLFVAGLKEVRIHRGVGTGRFEAPGPSLRLPGTISSTAAGDIDADGDDDLIAGRILADCDGLLAACSRLEVFLFGGRALEPAGEHSLDGHIGALRTADIDGDGALDVLPAIDGTGSRASRLQILMGSERGLLHGRKITLADHSSLVAARDLDGDGDPDIVLRSGAGLSILRNESLPPALRDADGDGVPDQCERDPFRRGEADQDGSLSLSDAIAILGVLFQGMPLPPCPGALDADDSGRLDITDPIRILGHLFLGQGPLPEPFATCGADPTPDALACSEFGPCA